MRRGSRRRVRGGMERGRAHPPDFPPRAGKAVREKKKPAAKKKHVDDDLYSDDSDLESCDDEDD